MDRPKLVALITGIVSIALAVLYLALVFLLDHRSGLAPAPVVGWTAGLAADLSGAVATAPRSAPPPW
ncbi:MAG: hypothetical protein OXF25_04545 [Cyanobacteria bacterium MAG CAR3_bin_5]|nr:hypothetical protein [Cyanobacteria bacterium MAG CAR4_bin_6]MCY4173325.1 hypothetical protein [Cyanobacteria bacterium MAG CAR3_bin_5]MCY4236559.1 hypothetical protein [Cyanobacteria bacterium MAG CAR2_bin_4]